MAGGHKNRRFTSDDDRIKEAVKAYLSTGLNVSAAARMIGKPRRTVKRALEKAVEFNLLSQEEIHTANAPSRDAVISARTRKLAAYQKKQRVGNWDKPVLVHLPAGPFRLKVFGDPHMDSDAFNIALWEKHWMEMRDGVYGVCVGDWFNNWLKVLAHLWKHEGDPAEAWTLFEHYMAERGEYLLAACSGNHDDWTHGPADPIDLMMKRYGVVYRKGAVRLVLQAGEQALTCAIRHKWKGHSQFSPAHALRRAAEKGWHDNLMIGGHIHQDEPRMYVQPRTGHISHLCQVSAFKDFDEFADVHGFMPHKISPVWDYVIDPSRADSDPDKIKVFWDSDAAAAYLAAIK